MLAIHPAYEIAFQLFYPALAGSAAASQRRLLAATGIEHKLTIVTRNTDDFLRSGANTLNPLLPATSAS